MAENKKISELTELEELKGQEMFPLAVGGGNNYATAETLKNYCATPIGETADTAFDGARGKAVEDKANIISQYKILGRRRDNIAKLEPIIIRNYESAINIDFYIYDSELDESSNNNNFQRIPLNGATNTKAGLMSAADKQKLDSLSNTYIIYIDTFNKENILLSEDIVNRIKEAELLIFNDRGVLYSVYNSVSTDVITFKTGLVAESIDIYQNHDVLFISKRIFLLDPETRILTWEPEYYINLDKEGDGTKFLADDGTYKAIEMPEAEGLPTFSLTDDLASGNGVISSSVWERLTAARTANTPIVVVNDMGSLPVANVAILGFGNNAQLQGTTDIIMPARINDLENYTVTQTVYQITGGGSTYQIATVTKNLKFYNSGNGTKFLSDDGTYKEITIPEASSDVYVIDYITAENGTLTDEQYQELYDAVQQKKMIFFTQEGTSSYIQFSTYYIDESYITLSVTSSSNYNQEYYITQTTIVVGVDKKYVLSSALIPLLNGTSIEDNSTNVSAAISSVLDPNKFYRWGEVGSLTILSLSDIGLQEGKLAEYMFEFKSGATPTVLTLPENVKWIGSHTVEANKTYQVSIVNNLAVMGGA